MRPRPAGSTVKSKLEILAAYDAAASGEKGAILRQPPPGRDLAVAQQPGAACRPGQARSLMSLPAKLAYTLGTGVREYCGVRGVELAVLETGCG